MKSRDKGMNILYLEPYRGIENNGGKFISNRNKESLKKYCKKDGFYSYTLSPYKNLTSKLFFSLFSFCGGMRLNDNKRLKKIIIEENIDLVFVDNSTIGKLSNWIYKNTKVVYFFHNVEYLYKKQELVHFGLLRRIRLRIMAFQLYRNENNICRKADGIITLNKRDSDCLNSLYKRNADFIWPTTFEDKYKQHDDTLTEDRYMLFVGYNFFGNVEGLTWFINNCLSKCKLRLKVVGSGMDELSSWFDQDNVEFIGYVPDLAQLYIDASFIVLPIISGSGMKTKTCEAFMYGKTVIGTTEAFEGYDNLDPSFAIVCNTADEFVNEINRLTETQESKINNSARQYFLDNYETSVFDSKLNRFIDLLD